jgi:pimeloyl-ACP methyl ester carboxylesterase
VKRWAVLGAVMAVSAPVAGQEAALPGGAQWVAEMPAQWNGTLLLWSLGYSPNVGKPETAPVALKAELLAAGYALAGSDYGSGGWALEQAVPAQSATVAAFKARYGAPKRVLGWGFSMGGLVTTALVEQSAPPVDGGIAFCASIGGSVGMMNMALDGATAFKTLVAPSSDIRLTGVDDDRVNSKRVGDALAVAMKSPEGRARVALSGVLAGIPGWTSRDRTEPAAGDSEAQVDEMARAFVMGVFLPRAEQEQRAGIGYSWTVGVDYRKQLALSGRRSFVEALYRKAGLSLDADLATLNAAPRIASVDAAKAYMLRNYTPNARPTVPLLAVQAKGDGATSPSLQRGFAEAAGQKNFQSLWLNQAGHCGFSGPQILASLRVLEARLSSGTWGKNQEGFTPFTPPPMLRPCVRGRHCR